MAARSSFDVDDRFDDAGARELLAPPKGARSLRWWVGLAAALAVASAAVIFGLPAVISGMMYNREPPIELYSCQSDLKLGPVENASQKGMCLDDTTFSACIDEIPEFYPNTKDRITSLRLFAPWKTEWPEEKRLSSWKHLYDYLKANNAKILLGAEITCYLENDAQVWEWTKELISMIGAEHVMGLAIGNEMDLLHFKKGGDPPFVPEGCIERLWADQDGPNSFNNIFISRIAELDQSVPGFKKVPVTTVWSLYLHSKEPFLDNPKQVMAKSFLEKAVQKYGTRFVFSFNVYPYFDPNNVRVPCRQALEGKLCFTSGCFTNILAVQCRRRMKALLDLMGRPHEQYRLWMGESGWSHPVSDTTQEKMKQCEEWSSKETFMTNYDGWLKWDLTLDGAASVDHAFFFTMRDSYNFGKEEHFGLVYKCNDTQCKLQPDPVALEN